MWVIFIYVKLPLTLLSVYLFVFGFMMTAFTLCWTVGNEVNDRRLSGMATGVVNCVGFLGAAIIPVIMGNILDANKNMPEIGYKKAYLVLTAAAIEAAGLPCETVNKVTEGRPHVVDAIKNGEIVMVINTVEKRRNAIADSAVDRKSVV